MSSREEQIVDVAKHAIKYSKNLTYYERELGEILLKIWENKHFIEVEDLEKLSYFIYKQKWNKQYYL